MITGLLANDIELEVAKKFFAQKFACSCSKGEGDELIIQGDVVDHLFDVIPEKYTQVKMHRTYKTYGYSLGYSFFNFAFKDHPGNDGAQREII